MSHPEHNIPFSPAIGSWPSHNLRWIQLSFTSPDNLSFSSGHKSNIWHIYWDSRQSLHCEWTPAKSKLSNVYLILNSTLGTFPFQKARTENRKERSKQDWKLTVQMVNPTNVGLTTRNFDGTVWVTAHLGNVTLLPLTAATYMGALMSQQYSVSATWHDRCSVFLTSTIYGDNYCSIGFTFTASLLFRDFIQVICSVHIAWSHCFLEPRHKPRWSFNSWIFMPVKQQHLDDAKFCF